MRRIAIIGGGMAGISAAHFLRRKGYAATVFERETRLGGKCCSVKIDGLVFELGAAVLAPGYTEVRKLLREFNLATELLSTRGRCGLYDFGTRERRRFGVRATIRILTLLAKFYWHRLRAGAWKRPGFAHIRPDLSETFSKWLQRHGLAELEDIFAGILTGYGYGYASEIPAAYALKYLTPAWTLPSLIGNRMWIVRDGYQTLVERMAAGLDVRLGAAVHKIETEGGLTVFSDRGAERFDHVIFAAGAPPAGLFANTDATLERLCREIRNYSLHILATDVAELPGSVVCVASHLRAEAGRGRLSFGYQRWPQHSRIAVLLGLAHEGASETELHAAMCADAEHLGKSTGKILESRRWDFFPHVSPAGFAAGFYAQLEAAQGLNGIYFAGELMAFPVLETIVRYSRRLIDTHF